jgi:AraC family transcriptional regulator of adaptative response/methylated-DNA-[protein]-cysteine methyltransferase
MNRGYSSSGHEQTLRVVSRHRSSPRELLRFSTAPCALGHLLLAGNEQGLRVLWFGDSAQALETELRQHFSAAQVQRDTDKLTGWLEPVLRQLAEPFRLAQVPLDLRGTLFQQQVWRALQHIPRGQTLAYRDLAATLGSHPRAVARACASNPLALLVPCRVARKAALLQAERSSPG